MCVFYNSIYKLVNFVIFVEIIGDEYFKVFNTFEEIKQLIYKVFATKNRALQYNIIDYNILWFFKTFFYFGFDQVSSCMAIYNYLFYNTYYITYYN